MKPQLHKVTVADGISSEIRYWRSEHDSAPALLVLPALGIPAGAYRRFCEAVCAGGAHVLSIDLRGVGSSSVRASRGQDWGYADLLNGEVQTLLDYATEQLPESQLYWFCHSMGGHLAVLHSINQHRAGSTPMAGLVLAASGSPQLDLLAPQVRYKARFLVTIVKLMLATLGVFRGDWVGFGGRQARTLMREWAAFVRDGTMPLGNPRLSADQAPPLRTLGLALAGDDYAPASAVTALLERLGVPAQVEPLANPDGSPLGHTDWLKTPQAVAERAVKFITG